VSLVADFHILLLRNSTTKAWTHIALALQIRETPHRNHHKFVEFYDVRAAEAALHALNKSDIAGKRIKLEASCPGGLRRWVLSNHTNSPFIFPRILSFFLLLLLFILITYPI
jgi:hypothetical protein